MNILFLDIDGVLQAYNATERFNNDLNKLQKELAVKYNDEKYLLMDKYDLGAVVFDWNHSSLTLLKEVLDDNQCRIVVHSGWREWKNEGDMERLLRLQGLDKYYMGDVEMGDKSKAIQKYLSEHPEITNYVVVDDDKRVTENFSNHMCLMDRLLKQADIERINRIFQDQF